MVPTVGLRKVVGSTVHSKDIHVMAKSICNKIYGSHKKVKMVEGVVINVDRQITKKSRKQFYVIAEYKIPDGSVKSYMIHINSVVAGPVIVPVPVSVNLPATAPIFTATKTTIVPANPSTSIPADHSTPVDPAPVPTITTTNVTPSLLTTTTTVPDNRPTIFFPAPEPTITTTVPYNPPTPVFPEPDTTTTTSVYANPHTQISPVPDQTPPPQNSPVPDLTTPTTPVDPVTDTIAPTISTPAVVADYHGLK